MTGETTRKRKVYVRVFERRECRIAPEKPVLILDATADKELNERILGRDIKSVEIHAIQNLHVTQVSSTSLSVMQLLARGSSDRPLLSPALEKVSKIVAATMANADQGLVVMPKKVEVALEILGEIQRSGNIAYWHRAEVTHFGAIRGRNRWKDFDTIVVIGRNQPPAPAVDGYLRAHTSNEPEQRRLVGNREFDGADREIHLADGKTLDVGTSVHSDPLGQLILEQIREAETIHAIGRLRSVHSDKPKRVIILSNVPLDIIVDRVCSLDELAETTARDKTIARLQEVMDREGTLPLGARDLAQAYPDLFPKEWQAKDALKAVGSAAWLAGHFSARPIGDAPQGPCAHQDDPSPADAPGEQRYGDAGRVGTEITHTEGPENGGINDMGSLYQKSPHYRLATYRCLGQRGRSSHAIIDTERHQDPEAATTRLLGSELARFELRENPSEKEN